MTCHLSVLHTVSCRSNTLDTLFKSSKVETKCVAQVAQVSSSRILIQDKLNEGSDQNSICPLSLCVFQPKAQEQNTAHPFIVDMQEMLLCRRRTFPCSVAMSLLTTLTNWLTFENIGELRMKLFLVPLVEIRISWHISSI